MMRKITLIALVFALLLSIPVAHAEIDEAAAKQAAIDAVCELYTLDAADFAEGYRFNITHPGSVWDIGISPEKGEAFDEMFVTGEMEEFLVEIDDETGEAISVGYWGNGYSNDLEDYTDPESVAYVAEHRVSVRFSNNWINKLLEEEQSRGEQISYWPVEDAAAFYEEYVIQPAEAQGITLTETLHARPPEGALTAEQAQAIAEQILRDEYHLTDEDFAQMPVVTQCWTHAGNEPPLTVWRFDFLSPTEAENTGIHYVVELDVMDGTISNLFDMDISQGNG